MKKWLVDILRDNDGKFSLNRPFYIVFMVLFVVSYFKIVFATNRFPDVPYSTLAIMAFMYGYETAKKFLISRGDKV